MSGADLDVGFTHEILEIQCWPKNQRIHLLKVLRLNGVDCIDRTKWRHAVFKVTLKNSEQYALDVSCAQYGWSEPIMPWDIYERSRIQSITKTSEFGSAQKEFRYGYSDNGRLIHVQYGIMDEFGRTVDEVFDKYRLVVTFDWLRYPEDKFAAEKRALLRILRLRLAKAKTVGEEIGIFQRTLLENYLSYMHMCEDAHVVL